jgi:hypothetical protein
MSAPSVGFRRVAVACMSAGALGHAWELLAIQAPSSPWHVGGFPLAVARFALHAWITGLAVWALAPRRRDGSRALLALTAAGAALSLGALGASAATGLLGVQIRDARAGSAVILGARVVGGVLLAVAMAWGARERLREA